MLGIGCPDRHALPPSPRRKCAEPDARSFPRERVRSAAHLTRCRTFRPRSALLKSSADARPWRPGLLFVPPQPTFDRRNRKVSWGWLPALGTRGFHRLLSVPRADLQLRSTVRSTTAGTCQFRTPCSQLTSPLERQQIENAPVTLALFENSEAAGNCLRGGQGITNPSGKQVTQQPDTTQ